MARFAIEAAAPGRFEVSGELTFATAADALRRGFAMIDSSRDCTVGLGGVAEADSAGLAVLIEWLATARTRGVALRYESVPPQIMAVARISDVQDLLGDPEDGGQSHCPPASSPDSSSSGSSGGLPS